MATKQYPNFGIFLKLISVPVRTLVYFKEWIKLICVQPHT